jgi:hypothetical protein
VTNESHAEPVLATGGSNDSFENNQVASEDQIESFEFRPLLITGLLAIVALIAVLLLARAY